MNDNKEFIIDDAAVENIPTITRDKDGNVLINGQKKEDIEAELNDVKPVDDTSSDKPVDQK